MRSFLLSASLLALASGCEGSMDGGVVPRADAGPRVDGGAFDGGGPAETDGGGAATDGGAPDAGPLGPREAPGGELGSAPIVGCEGAERPARALASVDAPECGAVAGGRCWYVHPDGDDVADGSFAAPLRRPQIAVRGAQPGDVIYLRGGVYGSEHGYDTAARVWDDSGAGLRHEAFRIGRVVLPSWAGGESFTAASGTEEAPIVIRSYPGERACFDGAGGIGVGSLGVDTAWWRIEEITLRRGAISVGGGSGDGEQTHHVFIERNEIYEHEGRERDNVGLVKVDRGDQGGPYEIVVRSNILHDLYVNHDDGVRRDWSTTTDAQHFGGVTTLSCETYFGIECGGNGRLVIENNHVYRVPSAFFFKNPSAGPFEVRDNVIHHAAYLGNWAPSNITFENNHVHDVGGGAVVGNFGGGEMGSAVGERAGRNLRLLDNTFVDMSTVATFWITGAGHTVRGNVVQGLRHSMSAAGWDTRGYVSRHEAFAGYPDSGDDITGSAFAHSDFGGNCLVTDVSDFIAVSRYRDTSGGWVIERLTLDEARTALAMETDSIVVPDPAAVFADPAAGDYTVRATGPCATMGAR